MSRILCIISILFIMSSLPIVCISETFTEDGYSISMDWRQSNETFFVKGVIKDGVECKQLNLSIFFENSADSSGIAHIETPINYHTTNGVGFDAKDKVYVDRKYKNKWFVDSIYIRCVK